MSSSPQCPKKNRSGELNAMRSMRRETKDKRGKSSEQRYKMKTLRMGSRESNARRKGNGTDEKSSGQCATEQIRDGGKSSEKCATRRNGTVGKERAGNAVGKNFVSCNSRINLSHTLGRRRETTARQCSLVHYGA